MICEDCGECVEHLYYNEEYDMFVCKKCLAELINLRNIRA